MMRPRTREPSRTVSFHWRCNSTRTASHQVSAKGFLGRAAGWLSSLHHTHACLQQASTGRLYTFHAVTAVMHLHL